LQRKTLARLPASAGGQNTGRAGPACSGQTRAAVLS